MEWKIQWLETTWWSWPPQDLPMFWATLVAASVALWYIILAWRSINVTRRGVENAWKGNQSTLIKQFLEEYVALAGDVDVVRGWWERYPSAGASRYENDLRAAEWPRPAVRLNDARRRISQYFMRLRALCEKGLLDSDLVAATLGEEAIQVFLLYVDPLDEVVRRVSGKTHNVAERDYFKRYLREYFPQSANNDPWGIREDL